MIGSLAFAAPWLLAGLLALPVLWWLLRAVPPAPVRRAFPGVMLLLGLQDPERMPERTPWWLLVLRMLAIAAAILAFSGPVLNPRPATGDGPLLVLIDGGWGDAAAWSQRMDRLRVALEDAGREGRPVAVVSLAADPPAEDSLPFRTAGAWAERLAGIEPRPYGPDRAGFAEWLGAAAGDDAFDTLWLTDGIADGGEQALAERLLRHGAVTLVTPASPAIGLSAPRLENGALSLTAVRADATGPRSATAQALGPDPSGVEQVLAQATVRFEDGETAAPVAFDLPLELRNRVSRVILPDHRSAGAVALSDDALRQRKVGLLSARAGDEAQALTDPEHYLRNALSPTAEVISAPLDDILSTAPDVVIMADIGVIADAEREALQDWVERGGVLIRFAGPRLAAAQDGQVLEDPLLPVRLRAGGRSLGGAMSWGVPRTLRPFPEDGPFQGLPVPDEVTVLAQVMAQPDPELPGRVMAALDDGTPLVTGRGVGQGRVVLFHVTANADWSNLPLSGLFVQMLERLTQGAGGLGIDEAALADTTWTPVELLDGFGVLQRPLEVTPLTGAQIANDPPSAAMPPGIYQGGEMRVAVNTLGAEPTLMPLAPMPSGVVVEDAAGPSETRLAPWLLAAALILLAIDVLATLRLSGRLGGGLRPAAAGAVLLLAGLGLTAGPAGAETDDAVAMHAANNTVLAYVVTGDRRVDEISKAGLRGLSRTLYRRTAIEPVDPVAVNPEEDDLALYPFLYWPVTEAQPPLSAAAYAALNEFLRTGGMILFDTRDAQLGGQFGATTPNGRMLQEIARNLNIPPLEPVPDDHVLTRTFYLLNDFPGRWTGGTLWVEEAPDPTEIEGMPFRDLNDGVTPVIIGANDFAAAWAEDERGLPLFPVGRGVAGERQREMAHRFGVNLIMYVMTGNYKSDQVHVPALLERLGQ